MKHETTIITPQFKNGKWFENVKQVGVINDISWIFTPVYKIYGTVGMHVVYFWTEENYLKAKDPI